MAVTISERELAVELRLITTRDGYGDLAEGVTEVLARVLATARAEIEDYAPGAPSDIQDEAAVRFASVLYDESGAESRGGNPMLRSGAAGLLSRWRTRRVKLPSGATPAAGGGLTADELADALATALVAGNNVTITRDGDTFRIAAAAGIAVDATARAAAADAQAAADAAAVAAAGARTEADDAADDAQDAQSTADRALLRARYLGPYADLSAGARAALLVGDVTLRYNRLWFVSGQSQARANGPLDTSNDGWTPLSGQYRGAAHASQRQYDEGDHVLLNGTIYFALEDNDATAAEIPGRANWVRLGGLDQAAVDARVAAGVEDWAETGNASLIPAAKLTNAPGGEGGGLDQAADDARVAAGVEDWAETGDTSAIPAAKLSNAPSAVGLTDDELREVRHVGDAVTRLQDRTQDLELETVPAWETVTDTATAAFRVGNRNQALPSDAAAAAGLSGYTTSFAVPANYHPVGQGLERTPLVVRIPADADPHDYRLAQSHLGQTFRVTSFRNLGVSGSHRYLGAVVILLESYTVRLERNAMSVVGTSYHGVLAALPQPSSGNNEKLVGITDTGYEAVDAPSGGVEGVWHYVDDVPNGGLLFMRNQIPENASALLMSAYVRRSNGDLYAYQTVMIANSSLLALTGNDRLWFRLQSTNPSSPSYDSNLRIDSSDSNRYLWGYDTVFTPSNSTMNVALLWLT